MKKEIRVVVFEDDDLGDDVPETPEAFIEFWMTKIALIPPEYKDTAKIELEGLARWECGYLECIISYTRLETDEEEKIREKREQDNREWQENKELRELERLRNKYGV